MRADAIRTTCKSARHLLCLSLLGAASMASAQNLLSNPNFAGGTLAPWGAGITTFDPQSASADGTGSVSGTYTGAYGVALAMNQCVLITAGSYYNFAGKVLIPSGQTTPGSTHLYTKWYSSTTCGVGYISGSDNKSNSVISPAAANGTWIAVQGDGIAPVGAQSVWLAGSIFKNSSNSTLQVKFDELSFQLAPPGNFVLTVTRSGTSSGTVTGIGIDCGGGSDCTQSLAPNATITLTAIPNYYANFAGWSGGGCSGTAPTCTVTMSAAQKVDAKFDVAPTIPLALTFAGTGTGTVAFDTDDTDCSASCIANIPENKTTTLTATAAAGSVFAGWSGGGCSGTGSCTVTVTAATAVTATFNLAAVVPTATISVPTLNFAMLLLLTVFTAALAWAFSGNARRPR